MKQIALSAAFFFICLISIAQKQLILNDFKEDFDDSSLYFFRYGSTGNQTDFKWKAGVPSPTEQGSSILLFKIDPNDSAGPGRGPEIISKDFTHFGTYSARLKVPDVKATQPNAGAVVGYFTYHMDSIEGLSEIDFEWLIADPTIIYIGTWTGHNGELKRIGRIINMSKGIIYNTEYKVGHQGAGTPLTGMQNQPEEIPAIEDYDASRNFYTYGFDWYSDRLRWWIIHPKTNEKIMLWDYSGSQVGIPQNASRYRMNFWHTRDWSVHTNPKSVEKPLKPYPLEIDWMSYEPLKK